MRLFLAGFIHLLLTTITLAGVIGKVDSIGFESQIRADCWVPLLVQITSDSAGPEDYQLQVVQHDIDGDDVIYARPVTVNPGSQNPFWTYFKPESIDNGLPTALSGAIQDLPKRLRVYLATPDGSKRIVQINVSGSTPIVLDASDQRPGDKLILTAGRRPNTVEFDPAIVQNIKRVSGLAENVVFAAVDTRHMPDNVLGYDMVDAVVWTDSEIDKLDATQFRALRQYVRGGGTLVVLQNSEKARMARLDDFLPVRVQSIETTDSLEPLRTIMHKDLPSAIDPQTDKKIDPLRATKGPFRIARAEAFANAVVGDWISWPDGTQSPYIARHVYGMGMVVWVAQDVTDPGVRDIIWGWPNFWAHVFDWPTGGRTGVNTYDYAALPPPRRRDNSGGVDDFRKMWASTGIQDIGASYVDKLDLDNKTVALLSLAFLFFIGYWIIAGPGAYLLLAAKKKAHWSWFIYGATAVLATLLTVALAQLVLRGNAQIRHVSLIRVKSDGGEPAAVRSRMGIYLPQDRSDTQITLTEHDTGGPSVITPLAVDPRFAPSSINTRDSRYVIPITNDDMGEQVTIEVPFRSTLKKLQAAWTGTAPGRVTGVARLLDENKNLIAGNLSNNTGRDLSNVLMVFSYPTSNGMRDYVLYQRVWPNGQTIDLEKTVAAADRGLDSQDGALPLDRDKGSFGQLRDAERWIYRRFRTSMTNFGPDSWRWNDSNIGYRQSFIIASLYTRLAPMRNEMSANGPDRADILRRGVRDWDMSQIVAAGGLLIIAQSHNDQLPLPLTVEGTKPEGTGTNFWQFVLPLDRSKLKAAPATQPASSLPPPLRGRAGAEGSFDRDGMIEDRVNLAQILPPPLRGRTGVGGGLGRAGMIEDPGNLSQVISFASLSTLYFQSNLARHHTPPPTPPSRGGKINTGTPWPL